MDESAQHEREREWRGDDAEFTSFCLCLEPLVVLYLPCFAFVPPCSEWTAPASF